MYAVAFALGGFSTVKREGIEVASNVSVPVNAQLRVGALEETVTVSGATPVVDVQQAAQRQVLSREVLDALPTARALYSTGAIVPGLKLTRPDMGGTASVATNVYLQARGKAFTENAIEVDGMDIRNVRQDGNTQPINFAAAQEVTYQTSSIGAEASGGGVRLNVIPRDGGNLFKGDVYAGGMNHNWQSNNITPELKAAGLPSADSTRWLAEVNPAFGGPIRRDKVWFFGSVRLFKFQLAPGGSLLCRRTAGIQRRQCPQCHCTVDPAADPTQQGDAVRRSIVEGFVQRRDRSRPRLGHRHDIRSEQQLLLLSGEVDDPCQPTSC